MDFPPLIYDVLMLLVLVLCTAFGAWKGMAWQLAALASLVVSAGVAVRFSGLLAPYFGDQVPWNRCIAMLVLYVATSLGIWLLFRLVSGMIDRVRLKEFDRQVGAMFGLAKGLLWCLVITFFAVTLSESARQKILRSNSGYYVVLLIHRAAPALPPRVREVLGDYIETLHEKLHPEHEKLYPDAPPANEPEGGTTREPTAAAKQPAPPPGDAAGAGFAKPWFFRHLSPRADRT